MQSAFKEKILKLFKSAPNMDKMGFLSSFFKTTEEDYTDAEYVDIDIVRSGENVAPVLRDIGTGAVVVADDVFTGKQIKPPVYSLVRPVNIFDLMKRQPGENEYSEIGTWYGRLVNVLKRAFTLMAGMLVRSVEFQASQVLQTGKLTLTDDAGNAVYTLDFQPKATHFKTITNLWSGGSADPLADLEEMADAIRDDGLVDAANVIFGANAWNLFIKDTKVQNSVKKDGLGLGNLSPRLVNKGGKYMGYVEVGAYRLDLWVYNGRYSDFGSTTVKKYVDDDKVIMLADVEDLDLRTVYGGVPSIGMDAPFNEIIPEEVTHENGVRVHNRVYKDQKGNTYSAESTVRPVSIPVSIDRIACFTVA